MSTLLGSLQAEYAVSGVKNRANLWVGRLLMLLGPLLLVYAIYRRLSMGSDGLDVVCGGVGSLLLLMGVFALWEQRRDRSVRVQVHDQGLVYARNGKTDVVRWDEVDAAVMSVTSIRGSGRTELDAVYGYTIRRQDGSELKFRFNKNSIRNIDDLSQRIQQEVTRRKLPQALATLQAGGEVQFGRLRVDGRGITNGKEHVPWNEIEELKVRGGKITIRKKGKWLDWSNVAVSDTPNVFVFLTLVDGVMAHNAEMAQAIRV